MSDDNDWFEPHLGRPRSLGGKAAKSFHADLMRRVARAGGNPRRLRSSLTPKPPPKAAGRGGGRFNGRGRGARVVASFPRDSGWSFDRSSGLRVRMRRVTVKARFVKPGKGAGVRAHLRYLERDGVTRDGEPGRAYSAFTDEADRAAFIERGAADRHQFRFIVSPEDREAYADLKPFIRELMAQMAEDLNTSLDWVAVDHHDTGHPHVHILMRGVTEDGKVLNIAGDYLAHGIRYRASELLTRDLGHQTEWELHQQLEQEVDAERFTRLDRDLVQRADDGVVDLRLAPGAEGFAGARQQLLIGRLRRLQEMGLAEKTDAPLRWSLAPEAEATLRAMGERGDIIKTLHRAMSQSRIDRSSGLYAIDRPSPGDAPIIGQVVARGLVDETADRRWVAIDGLDGRSHYVDVGELDTHLPQGALVQISSTSIEPRKSDHTIAEVAAANGGRYSIDIHLDHDRSAHESFAEAHIRRLEAIRRATQGQAVGRELDGTWIVAPDHLDRVRAYERDRAQTFPVTVTVVSPLSIERQVNADGPTWLDRELMSSERQPLAPCGLGAEAKRALVQRMQWLTEQELIERQGDNIAFRNDLLDQLRRRELRRVAGQLSQDLGLEFYASRRGEHVEGVFKRSMDLASGRYAVIANSREFTLVPWRPELERHLGRTVSGIDMGDATSWTLGRGRGLSR